MEYRRHICWAFRLFDESFMCFAILHMVLTHINAAPPSLTIPVKARILCISLNFKNPLHIRLHIFFHISVVSRNMAPYLAS